LKEENRARAYENTMLRKIFGPKMKQEEAEKNVL
jgi:hypothetical protein